MSAIFGMLRFDGGEVSARDLDRMMTVLRHRGLEARRYEVLGGVGLGHCLTHVNHEDRFEVQPLADDALDLTLVADCRIDNREALAATYGWDVASLGRRPDSAFILEAYRRWGDRCCERLIGDFAFALWDGRRARLLLARDQGGQRGILFHRGPSFLAFATEARALLALPEVPTTLSDAELVGTMMPHLGRRSGRTLFEAIEGVPAATVISVSPARVIEPRRYWRPEANPRHIGHGEAYYAQAYRDLLGEAVACRIRRLIKPPALSLSGGFDSGSIAALAGPALVGTERRLNCVSAALPEDYEGPLNDARPMVEACRRHMPHIDIRFVTEADADPLSRVELIAMTLCDSPRSQVYMVDAIFKAASEAGSRLILQGYGGDLTLHPRDGRAIGWLLRKGRFRSFAHEFGIAMRETRVGAWPLLRSTFQWAFPRLHELRYVFRARFSRYRALKNAAIRPAKAKGLVLDGSMRKPAFLPEDQNIRELADSQRRWLEKVSAIAAPYHGPLAACHGLEVSKPYLDPRVVELGLAIPRELHFRDGRARHLARVALEDLYPPEFQSRGPRNDAYVPNYNQVILRHADDLRAKIADLRNSPRLNALIDFTRLEENLFGENKVGVDSPLSMRILLVAWTIDLLERPNEGKAFQSSRS